MATKCSYVIITQKFHHEKPDMPWYIMLNNFLKSTPLCAKRFTSLLFRGAANHGRHPALWPKDKARKFLAELLFGLLSYIGLKLKYIGTQIIWMASKAFKNDSYLFYSFCIKCEALDPLREQVSSICLRMVWVLLFSERRRPLSS